MLRLLTLGFLCWAMVSCKKDDSNFNVPIQLENESYILAIDAHTGLYNTNIQIETFEANTGLLLSVEHFTDSLILLSRNEVNNILFGGEEYVFEPSLNSLYLYEEMRPLVFESLSNQSNVDEKLYLDTMLGKITIESRTVLATGELIVKSYTGILI